MAELSTLMSTQNADNVAVTGGKIDGTTIGATTTAAGSFTTLAASAGITGNVTGQLTMTRNAPVAAAGTTVTDAAQLSAGFTVVTGANGTVGVKLPPTPAAGTIVWIKGTTAGVLKVWPDAAATINAIGSNGALSLTTGVIPSLFIADSTTQWYSLPLVAS